MFRVCLSVVMAVVVAGCAAASPVGVDSTNVLPVAVEDSSPIAVTASTTTSTSPMSTSTSTSTTSTTQRGAAFFSEVLPIDDEIAARMIDSWHQGCPVGLDELRLLRLSYHDLDGEVRTGELVVNADVADDVVGVFEILFIARFPIERMELVDAYGGDDLASMQANNTSGFNCRYVGGTSRWSEHAYGRAIDINPLLNPWVRGTKVSPPEGARYVDRSLDVSGMIHDGDVVVTAFREIGWTWGGTWKHSKDYQHFSQSGR